MIEQVRPSGFGTYWRPGSDNFFSHVPPQDRIAPLGYLQGCGNPPAIEAQLGNTWTVNRYIECNLVGAFVVDMAQRHNPELARALMVSHNRPPTDTVVFFHPRHIPDNFFDEVPPGMTPWGYGVPRVLIEQFGRDGAWNIYSPRVTQGVGILRTMVQDASHPADLLLRLSERVTRRGKADAVAVLGHVLAREHLENGTLFLLREVIDLFPRRAPLLWKRYQKLSEVDRRQAGILTWGALSEYLTPA